MGTGAVNDENPFGEVERKIASPEVVSCFPIRFELNNRTYWPAVNGDGVITEG
jgi:hypothetical protein